ncbi:hypothetical protein CHS0354_040402 [Potamilus streckersoni]|uniref:Uncharacterized protein n=1 Tax=Potamilus streckersoni TaxID=2493646 RepID=A0AAE0T0M0_9BIVA|nr:hypothetical protein CHS0354_040402 [Potamilus streckersoni]
MLKSTVVLVWVVIVIGTNSVLNVIGASISKNEEQIETTEAPSELGSGETLQIVTSALENNAEGSGTSTDIGYRQFDKELPDFAVQSVSQISDNPADV